MFSKKRLFRPSLLAALAAAVSVLAFAAGGIGGGAAQSPPDDAQNRLARPTVPIEYARAAFDAWLAGDAETLIDLTQPSVAQLLLARAPGEDEWATEPLCEGAAGSTYCSWAGEDSQLLLRVGSQAASAGQPHAVFEAAFIPTVDGVAIWPLSTQEEADNTQAGVDEGHSPWMIDPLAVGDFFATSVLGWQAPIVEPLAGPGSYRIVDSATGLVVDVEMSQPARSGPGGIWAIARLSSWLPSAADSACPPNPSPPDPADPSIIVDEPAGGASVSSPASISGLARVFEANVRIQVFDAAGSVLADTFTTADQGAPALAPFATVVSFEVDAPQQGCIRVFEESAKDGSAVNVVQREVTLLPAGR